MNYNNRKFRPVSNSANGEVTDEMIFHYKQEGNVLSCEYEGEHIIKGHLIGLVSEDGTIQMKYHQVNKLGQLVSGVCQSTPEVLSSGKVRLYEKWQWTSGDQSEGNSILEEV